MKSQRDYQDLKLKHEAVLANLTKTQTEADKVPALVDQVNALKPEAERVQGLEQDLARLQKLSQEWSDTDLKKIKKDWKLKKKKVTLIFMVRFSILKLQK